MKSENSKCSANSGIEWIPDPFLHVEQERIYNPVTDRTIQTGEAGFSELLRLHNGENLLDEVQDQLKSALIDEGWLVAGNTEFGARFLLRYVTLEATTACNQSCYFCPVSINPRDSHSMPLDVYTTIVQSLVPYKPTIEAVFMINYNEPTIDPLFVDRLKILTSHGLPPAVNTNATGLTPAKVEAILEMGGLRYLSVNFSTMDRELYSHDRGGDHMRMVLQNLDFVKTRPVAKQMDLAVLGQGDEAHKRDYKEIADFFQGTKFNVKYFEVMDRAGYLPIGLRPEKPHDRLRGCENIGSRPLQHLHITPHGKCILCCEDYDEKYEVGDLTRQSIEDVLTGPAFSLFRRWSYGLADAPDDFMCRKCVFARTH